MVAVLSFVSLVAGTAASCFADRLPVAKETAELIGGLLLVLGFVLIGSGLSRLFTA